MNQSTAQYSPGLAGVIAGETAICWVDPDAGLLYRGYDIHEIAGRVSFEEVAWLLLHGEWAAESEMAGFKRELENARELPIKAVNCLRELPDTIHPMDSLRTGVSLLGAFDPDLNDPSPEAAARKATRLIARISSVVTDGWRVLHGKDPVLHLPGFSHAANFLYRLEGSKPEEWRVTMLNTILVLYADHEFNASTFSARVTASTMADIYASVTTACATLKGPLHGGANEDTMRMLEEIGTPANAESWITDRLAKKEKITGFGHRVYKRGDSRVPCMRDLARELGHRFGQENWVPICEKLEAVMEREKQLCANVDLYAAPVLHLLDIPTELNTPVFAVARVAGWCAHIIEQQQHNRLIRPRSLYIGPARREFVPRSD